MRKSNSKSNSPPSKKRVRSSTSPQRPPVTHIFVGGLPCNGPAHETRESVMNFFNKKHAVETVEIRNKPGMNYRFAFVGLKEPRKIGQFVKDFDGAMFEGKKLKV